EFLGKSLKSITVEKAGIIKKKGVAVTAEARPALLGVIKKAALKQGAALYVLGRDFKIHVKTARDGRAVFDYCGIWERIDNIKLGLRGLHQVKNAACALATVEALKREGFKITVPAIKRGLEKTRWPGRFEVIKKKPLVILDSAHNIDGAKTLKEALKYLKPKRLFLVIGIMADKDVDGIVRELAPLACEVIASAPDTARAAVTTVIKKKCLPYAQVVHEASSVDDACALALRLAGKEDVVCVTGSMYTVGESKKYFGEEN
ncbi:bifunctional folylpolyglutamate synthase/dihydrofolate synthase, partial [bacterium]